MRSSTRLKTESTEADPVSSLDLMPIPESSRTKSGRKSRNKGSSYERRLCKIFSEFWESKFFRTPMSGGSHLRYDYNLAGDISTPVEDFPYHCEAKNQEAFKGFHTLFTSEKCPVWKWWKQSVGECPAGKIPLVIFTKNYLPSFVMMPLSLGVLLEDEKEFDLGDGGFHEFLRVKNCAVMGLDRFLEFGKMTHLIASKSYLRVEKS